MVSINTDCGEQSTSFFYDVEQNILPFVQLANVGCLFHGGDEAATKIVIEYCSHKNIKIGVHPSFPDRENFGRKELLWDDDDLHQLLRDQIVYLFSVCKEFKTRPEYLKLHGALSSISMKDIRFATSIIKFMKKEGRDLPLLVPAISEIRNVCLENNYQCFSEIFADRGYDPEGHLLKRSKDGALITNDKLAADRILSMIKCQSIITNDGKKIPCDIDSICIHSDTPNAPKMAHFFVL